jgi:hypothetical protein
MIPTVELDPETEDIEPRQVRRVVLVTLAILLPEDMSEADVNDIIPTRLIVTGDTDTELDALIQTTVQDARLVMT